MKSYETHVSRMACGGAIAVFLLLSGGCFRDPNVRKQEYVKAGDDYLSQARYKEAKIYYSKAIQIDPQMASAPNLWLGVTAARQSFNMARDSETVEGLGQYP